MVDEQKLIIPLPLPSSSLPYHPNVLEFLGCTFEPHFGLIFSRSGDSSAWDSLDLLLEKTSLSLSQKIDLAISIAQALEHLHKSGIFHQRLTLSSILVRKKIYRFSLRQLFYFPSEMFLFLFRSKMMMLPCQECVILAFLLGP